MQVQTLIEEKARFQDRLYEIEKQNYEKITQIERNSQVSQQKILEMTLQSQSKEIEFTKFKQESQIQLENTSNALKNTQEKLQELEKNARLFYQKAQELEKENALLIQEVVTYRKNQQIPLTSPNKNSQNPHIKIPNRKISKEIFNIDDFKHPDKGVITDEIEVHSMLFSEDMGPATPLKHSPRLKKSNFFSRIIQDDLLHIQMDKLEVK